jgi:hypothetical protein
MSAADTTRYHLNIQKLHEALQHIQILSAENDRLRKLASDAHRRAELAEETARRSYSFNVGRAVRR